MMNRIIAVELPKAKTYGAVELVQLINKHTIRGVIAAMAITLLLFLFVVISAMMQYQVYFSPITSITSVDISILTAPEANEADAQETAPPPVDIVVNTGPASRAGNPVAVPDAEVTPDMAEFSAMDEIERAASVGGTGEDTGDFSDAIDFTEVKEVKVMEEPKIDDFMAVEEEPAVSNLGDLMRLVRYPEVAKRAGIEGVVTVGVLVGADGTAKKAQIVHSANTNLNQAALDACLAYKGYTPAIQNQQPVACWLMIPLNFKLD